LAEVVSTTPSPAIAAADTMNRPIALPSELIIARRGPTAMEFDTASSTAGPGVKATSKVTPQKMSQLEKCTLGFLLGMAPQDIEGMEDGGAETIVRWPVRRSGGANCPHTRERTMVTCYLRYIVDAYKLKEFEHYGKLWIPLVEKFGGQHHGYFLPSEGTNNVALAMFTFPSLAAYETYRADSMNDAECQAAFRYAEETRCILSYERSFFRPVFK
jgi:hypothetical protein